MPRVTEAAAASRARTRIAAEEQSCADQRPKPAIARPRGAEHPPANPSRRAPPVDAPHQLAVRGRKTGREHRRNALTRNRHETTSPAAVLGSTGRFTTPQYQ